MAKNTIFEGAATALITPLNEKGVDYPALKKLIDWQIEEGIDALVICGTTGEGATLSDAEHKEVLRFSLEAAAGRVPMIAGTGSNDTAYAVQMTKHACQLGYDGVLVVTPYYNKATQNGLVAHYTAIAQATYQKMCKVPNLSAIKEANGNISSVVETAALCGEAVDIYSGNDDQIVPIMACGGKGVISVLSNLLPKETSQMCRKMLDGDVAGAMEMQKKYLALTNALFSEVNPIPVKAAMAAMGFCENYLRLPLTPMEEAHEKHLLACMREVGIQV